MTSLPSITINLSLITISVIIISHFTAHSHSAVRGSLPINLLKKIVSWAQPVLKLSSLTPGVHVSPKNSCSKSTPGATRDYHGHDVSDGGTEMVPQWFSTFGHSPLLTVARRCPSRLPFCPALKVTFFFLLTASLHGFFESKRQTQKRIKRVTNACARSSLLFFTKIENRTSQTRGRKHRSANNALSK